MVEGGQLAIQLPLEELWLSREDILRDFRAEMSTLSAELKQEIEVMRT